MGKRHQGNGGWIDGSLNEAKLLDATSRGNKNTQEYQALGQMTSTLKRGAARLDLALLVAGQQNREANKFKTGRDWAENPGQATGGTDRINQFATCVCDLRNLTLNEQEAVAARWPNIRPDREGDSALLFNQMLHVPFNRTGPTCALGMPLHHDKGLFRYSEVHKDDAQGHDEITPFLKQLYDQKAARKSRGTTDFVVPVPPTSPMGVQP